MIHKKLRYHFIFYTIAAVLLGVLLYPLPVKAEKAPVVVVIDPGHGGENLGAEYENYTEKEMNMTVALAMKEELEKYDNVTVYLTHERDEDMSLKDRALFAADKHADFLFCLHFNMSVSHNLYGAEVWVPAFGEYYVKGYQFAEIAMEQLTGIGLYSRGIKTKLNDRGEDYYGILRHCTANQVPSALIEHCHLDQEKDQPFYRQGEAQLKELGRLDAEAAAKFLSLTSKELSKDYSSYPKAALTPKEEAVKPDKTEPEVCSIEVLSVDEQTGEAVISMEASDSDSYILYYNYSLDGGNTYSPLEAWPRPVWNQSEEVLTFRLSLPYEQEIQLRANAYNGFDLWKESNVVTLPALSGPEAQEETVTDKGNYEEIILPPAPVMEKSGPDRDLVFLTAGISLLFLLMILITYAMVTMLFRTGRRNKRRKRR